MWRKHLKTRFYYKVVLKPRGSTLAYPSNLDAPVEWAPASIYWSGNQLSRLDGERCDSTVTQSLFVLHDWTHHAVRSRSRIEEQPTAVSLQPSTAIQQERRDWWDSGRWESEDTGSSRETVGAFYSANNTSSLFYSSMLWSVTQKSIEVRHHQACPKSLNVNSEESRTEEALGGDYATFMSYSYDISHCRGVNKLQQSHHRWHLCENKIELSESI